MFSKLSVNKFSEIHNVINKSNQKDKSRLNMTMKDLFRKQIIILIGMNNVKRLMVQSNVHVTNINRLFKWIKSEIMVNFIQPDSKGIIITTNKIAITSDFNIVEKYVKDLNNIDSSNIISPRLPQSNFYLKILDIPYWYCLNILFVYHESISQIRHGCHMGWYLGLLKQYKRLITHK